MSSNVKKIFVLLVTVVACVVIGAFVLNKLLPNAMTALVDTIEDNIYKATKIDWDLNGNGNNGSTSGSAAMQSGTGDKAATGAGVDGFE